VETKSTSQEGKLSSIDSPPWLAPLARRLVQIGKRIDRRRCRLGVVTLTPEEKLAELGLELPAPIELPPNLKLPFSFVNLRGDRALISGHPKQNPDGSIGGPFGQVGKDLTTQEAQLAARDIGLSILANLKAEIGELGRIAGWMRVFGMVNSASGYDQQHIVMNGFSDLIIDVFGADIGRHARSAIGVSGLPMNFAIEIEAEVLVSQA
jgi:enamine deaminase RidA (YjgF/YER057c/UK114 family)